MADTILRPVTGEIKIQAAAQDPQESFKDRKGIYVFSSFKERVLEKSKPTEALKVAIKSADLAEYSSDTKIEAELEEGHTFEESAVCALIASMIAAQPDGEDGPLKTTGDWNLFYTPACVVGVGWGAFGRVWLVGPWGRGFVWDVGARVFSPQLALES